MTVHRHHHLFRSKTRLACGCVQNPRIGLMRHDPVDVLGGKVRKVQRFDHYACELADGVSKNFLTPHPQFRSEEHTSELQSLMRTSYAVFCLKKKKKKSLTTIK